MDGVIEKYMFYNLKDLLILFIHTKSYVSIKQAPYIWYLLLCGVIVSLGFTVLETDTSIYIRGEIIIEVYVDDIKILRPNKDTCYSVYHKLCKHFKIQDKGAVKSFLGLNITRNWQEHSISINQPAYINRLLHVLTWSMQKHQEHLSNLAVSSSKPLQQTNSVIQSVIKN